MRREGNDRKERSQWQAVGFVSGLGVQFCVILAIWIFLGKQADAYFHIGTKGTLLGIICGFLTGIWVTYKKLLGKS